MIEAINMSQPDGHLDPFNQYNTEIVKLDAQLWTEEGPYLIKPAKNSIEFVLLSDTDQDMPTMQLDSVNNKSFTDVTFIVGPPQHSKKYVGHRVLLAMTSPVFETMFYGDMADKSKYIRIPDVAPIGFENLLRYAYTDTLNLVSVEDAMLTAYAAKKYLLPQLLRECLNHIEQNINPSTACVVFEFAHVLNSQQLVLQAMNLIDRQTISVVTSKTFAHVQASTVEFVANRKYLNLDSEFTLCDAVLSWSLSEARRRSFSSNDWTAIRSILNESSILGALRFLALSHEEFATIVLKTSSTTIEPTRPESPKFSTAIDGDDSSNEPSQGNTKTGESKQDGGKSVRKINVEDPNSLLTDAELKAILLNISQRNIANIPATLNSSYETRQAPPEYFSLRRFKSSSGNSTITTTTTRNIKTVSSKFQCLSENIFIVGLTIPIRLDGSSYANRTPKFECHLKFTTKSSGVSARNQSNGSANSGENQPQMTSVSPTDSNGAFGNSSQLLMDTIDESLHISISRDKDCLVRLKRPILIRMGNINELTLTFQTYALDEDIVALRTPKMRSSNFGEQIDSENISWLFLKTPNVEFSELHYYY